jgi:hypothetical protein
MQRQDLPAAIANRLVAAEKALDNEAAFGRPVAKADDLMTFRYVSYAQGKGGEDSTIGIAQFSDRFELVDEGLVSCLGARCESASRHGANPLLPAPSTIEKIFMR